MATNLMRRSCTNLKKINLQPNLVVGKGCFEGCPEINLKTL